MLCAHTVRRLKPGTFDDFAEAFRPPGDDPPAGWVRFDMLRGLEDPDVVISFGFFDGTVDELEASQVEHGYAERRRAAEDAYVEEVVLNGIYEVAMERVSA
ncbi:MAG: hypothetical protein JHC84_10875 [Solirubrobacteraceae bacterium]|nr:hypothetical protein [Solirubrobacteraceae bacterium]